MLCGICIANMKGPSPLILFCSAILILFSDSLSESNICAVQTSCSECIRADPDCAWCTQPGFSASERSQCDVAANLYASPNICNHTKVINPAIRTIVFSDPFANARVKIAPHKGRFKMRVGQTESFSLQVKTLREDVGQPKLRIRYKAPSGVSVAFVSNCTGFRTRKSSALCRGPFTIGGNVTFTVSLTLRECLGPRNRARVKLKVPPVRKRRMNLRVESLCTCDCEGRSQAVQRSDTCYGHGNLACGACACYDGWYGSHCECAGNGDVGQLRCIQRDSTVVCSGRGECLCGACQCHANTRNTRFYGQYCECDDISCPWQRGQLCGGPARGRCMCGTCQCQDGFMGDACHLSTSNVTCLDTKGTLCNEEGDCVNGVCSCHGEYMGPTCEECPTCPGLCMFLKDCVQCTVFLSGAYTDEQCVEECSNYDILIVDRLTEESTTCAFVDDSDGSFFFFTYELTPGGEHRAVMRVQRHKVYPGGKR